MSTIFSYIKDNNISQINIPKYGLNNDIACEFSIPFCLASQGKKVVVCLPDNFSTKLSYEYMKSIHPMIRMGYVEGKNVSYNLSTEINYITQQYLRYKILKYFHDNTRCQNFADIIIMLNPNMNEDNNIFIISSFKYANDNNILLPTLSILNTQHSYKLTENCLSFKNEKIQKQISFIDNISMSSVIKNVSGIVKLNYHKYTSDVLIYVSDLDTSKLLTYNLTKLMPDCKTLIMCNDYDKTINTFNDVLNIKTKKIIIMIGFINFHFENIGLVINIVTPCNKRNYPKALGYHLPNKYYTFKSEKTDQKILNKEDNIKSLACLITDYVNCDIVLDKLSLSSITNKFKDIKKPPGVSQVSDSNMSFKNVNLSVTLDLMKNLNLLITRDDKLLVSASGFFSQNLKLAPRKSSFIWEWILKEYPIFQGVLIISLIDEICLFMITKNLHIKWFDKSPMHTYLNIFNSFISDHKNDIENIIKNCDKNNLLICKTWADTNKIPSDKFLTLISNVSELYNGIVREMRNVNTIISNFDVSNLLDLAVPLLNNIYLETILIVRDNNIIQPHDEIIYLLNKYNIKNTLKNEKIIPLTLRLMINNNKDHKITEIISIDNFITI